MTSIGARLMLSLSSRFMPLFKRAHHARFDRTGIDCVHANIVAGIQDGDSSPPNGDRRIAGVLHVGKLGDVAIHYFTWSGNCRIGSRQARPIDTRRYDFRDRIGEKCSRCFADAVRSVGYDCNFVLEHVFHDRTGLCLCGWIVADFYQQRAVVSPGQNIGEGERYLVEAVPEIDAMD